MTRSPPKISEDNPKIPSPDFNFGISSVILEKLRTGGYLRGSSAGHLGKPFCHLKITELKKIRSRNSW